MHTTTSTVKTDSKMMTLSRYNIAFFAFFEAHVENTITTLSYVLGAFHLLISPYLTFEGVRRGHGEEVI